MMKIGKHATRIFYDKSWTLIKYHWTTVVKFNDKSIILDSGGWKTLSTKVRLNQVSNQFDLGFDVYQKKCEWYVDFNGKTYPFRNGMRLKRT